MTEGLDFLLPQPPSRPVDAFRFGTVTGVAPLRVRLDGDTDPVASTPASLVAATVGQRVWVQLHGRQLVVLGVVQ